MSILLLIVMLFASAMLSGSEIAYFSIGPADIDQLKQEGKQWSERILKLLGNEDKLLATILVFNNLINIGIVIISDYILHILFPVEFYQSLAEKIHNIPGLNLISSDSISGFLNVFITVVCVTSLLVLFGEIIPKVYAKFNHLKFAKSLSYVLTKLVWFFTPITNFLVNGSEFLEKKLSKNSNGDISAEEMDAAIKLTIKGNKHDKADFDILKAITQFGDVSVKQIMTSRVDIGAIDSDASFKEVMKLIRSSGYSRIPVYENNIDKIIGILYVKDFIKYIDAPDDLNWTEQIRTELMYIPESKKINDLLNEFQEQKKHMAIVVDEFGGCEGLVTLEDIMEEIVGDIKDEFHLESISFKKIDDFNYEFDGKTLINDFCKLLGIDIDYFDEIKGDADSLAGIILENIGFFPVKNQIITLRSFKFKIKEIDKRRIINIKVTIPKKVEA